MSRKKLLRKFGSLSGILKASHEDIVSVVGEHRAKSIDNLKEKNGSA